MNSNNNNNKPNYNSLLSPAPKFSKWPSSSKQASKHHNGSLNDANVKVVFSLAIVIIDD